MKTKRGWQDCTKEEMGWGVSFQSRKTVTSNKYQASEVVVWGGEENSVKMNIKVQSPLEMRGKEKERKKEKKEVGKNRRAGALLLGEVQALAAGGQAGNRERSDGAVGRCLWMWLHYRLARRNRWLRQEAFRGGRAQETWEGSHSCSTYIHHHVSISPSQGATQRHKAMLLSRPDTHILTTFWEDEHGMFKESDQVHFYIVKEWNMQESLVKMFSHIQLQRARNIRRKLVM